MHMQNKGGKAWLSCVSLLKLTVMVKAQKSRLLKAVDQSFSASLRQELNRVLVTDWDVKYVINIVCFLTHSIA